MDDIIKEVKKKKIDNVIAGGSNGSIVIFDLSEKGIKYVLYLYSSWRLSKNNKVLLGWNEEPISDESKFVLELQKLKGNIVRNIAISPLGDLSIKFDDGKVLDVFCDVTSDVDVMENWTICDLENNICQSLTSEFVLQEESYSG